MKTLPPIPVNNYVAEPKGLYVYKAFVDAVYDADTVTLSTDLGLRVTVSGEKFRLFGINAPEMRGPEKAAGIISRDWLREQVLGKTLLIETIKKPKSGQDKKGKYGRYLVKLFALQADGSYLDINAALVSLGLAKVANY